MKKCLFKIQIYLRRPFPNYFSTWIWILKFSDAIIILFPRLSQIRCLTHLQTRNAQFLIFTWVNQSAWSVTSLFSPICISLLQENRRIGIFGLWPSSWHLLQVKHLIFKTYKNQNKNIFSFSFLCLSQQQWIKNRDWRDYLWKLDGWHTFRWLE